MGSLDHFNEPDEPDQPERRGKPGKDGSSDRAERSGNADRPSSSGESESRAAERLGLTTLTRGEFYETQRSQADAQEAALQQRDKEASSSGESDRSSEPRTNTRAPDEAADSSSNRDTSDVASDGVGPNKMPWGRSGPKRDAPDIGGERWWSHPPEERPERDVEIGRGYYWTEVPRFLANWQHHKDRWPGVRRQEVDQSIDPERLTQVAELVEKVSEAEPPISDNLQKIEGENARGGWLEGFEFRLKGQDRLVEKATEKLAAEEDRTPEDVVQKIPDAIRYTFCFQQESYSNGYWDVKRRLEVCEYKMYHCKNWWTNPEYKGVNTRWVTPEGQRFEVQFHTQESFHAKHEVTHQAYERARSSLTSRAELAEIEHFQSEVSSWIPIPDRVREILDYKARGF